MKCEYSAYKEEMEKFPVDSKERIFLAGMVEAYWEVSERNGRSLDEIRAICKDVKILDSVIDSVQRKRER